MILLRQQDAPVAGHHPFISVDGGHHLLVLPPESDRLQPCAAEFIQHALQAGTGRSRSPIAASRSSGQRSSGA